MTRRDLRVRLRDQLGVGEVTRGHHDDDLVDLGGGVERLDRAGEDRPAADLGELLGRVETEPLTGSTGQNDRNPLHGPALYCHRESHPGQRRL